jgi:hypothetical protein
MAAELLLAGNGRVIKMFAGNITLSPSIDMQFQNGSQVFMRESIGKGLHRRS